MSLPTFPEPSVRGRAALLRRAFAVLVTFAAFAAPQVHDGAQAQPRVTNGRRGGVANSGMSQGEALINVRSDVRVDIRGAGPTTVEQLEQLTDAISEQMGATRACYAKIVKTRPATVGGLTLRITLEPDAKPKHEFEENEGSDEALTSCIKKVFKRTKYAGVSRPAAAVVTLEFQNSRAKGQEVMTEHRALAGQVQVRQVDSGGFEASYQTPDGRVSFLVSSPKSQAAVEAATGTLRDSFSAFLDCRRRAEKDGLSPAGDVDVSVQIQRGGKASGKVKSSTVAHERVIPCVERAFRRIKFGDSPAGRPVRVRITYAE